MSSVFKTRRRSAFTLLELIISITIFVIFIGFVMAAYLTFHRSQREVAITRGMLLEAESIFNLIGDELQDFKIHYDYYETESYLGESNGRTLELEELVLVSPDGEDFRRFYWEEDPEVEGDANLFYMQNDGEPLQLNGEGSSVDFIRFRVFPDDNPYEIENQSDPDFPHFQPQIRIQMTLSRAGGGEEDVTLDLQTSFTSRFYQ